MKRSPAWLFALAPVAGLLLAAAPVAAQMAPSPYYPAAAGYPVQPAYYAPYGMMPGGPPPAMYAPQEMLAGYNAPVVVHDPSVMPAAFGGCQSCGGGGCNACVGGAGRGLLQGGGCACGMDGSCDCGYGAGPLGPPWGMGTPGGIGMNNGQGIMTKHGPQGCTGSAEGCAGCCTPRWWDFQAEFMYMTREEVSRRVNFASQGVGGPIVLDTDDLDFDEEPGFRLMGSLLLGPGTNLEGGYFGTFHWDSTAQAVSANNDLFSAISQFGLINIPNLPEVNNSNLQKIDYSSELHNWELNVRRRWVSPNCRFHTSALVGARYMVLDEDFNYFISAGNPVIGTTNTRISTFNDLVGFQLGGDMLVCLFPGVKLGGNLKAGVYGNRAENKTNIAVMRPDPALNQFFNEFGDDSDAAFVGEGGFETIFEVSERTTLRIGYQLLYVNGVALAPENFNPDFRLAVRPVNVNHNGDVFYHGLQTGLEYTW